MQIYAKLSSGRTLALDVEPDDTIADVQQMCCEQLEVQADQVRLIRMGRVLPWPDRGPTLSDHDVGKEETIGVQLPEEEDDDAYCAKMSATEESQEARRALNRAALPAVPVAPPTSSLLVTPVTGRTLTVKVNPADSVWDVKVRLAHQLQGEWLPEEMSFIKDGEVVDDRREGQVVFDGQTSVADQIQNGDRPWHLLIRVRKP